MKLFFCISAADVVAECHMVDISSGITAGSRPEACCVVEKEKFQQRAADEKKNESL